MSIPFWALSLTYWLHMLATVVWIGGLAALALLAGTAGQLQQALWPQVAYAALCAAAAVLACLGWGLRSRPAVLSLLGVMAALVGLERWT